MNVLFISNSFTARHNLSTVVKAMAEAGNSGLTFNHTKIIYGGSTLKDHWRLGTQNIVKQSTLTEAEEKATISALEKAAAEDPKDRYAESALARRRRVAAEDRKQPAALGCRRAPSTAMMWKAIPHLMPSMRRSLPNWPKHKVRE